MDTLCVTRAIKVLKYLHRAFPRMFHVQPCLHSESYRQERYRLSTP